MATQSQPPQSRDSTRDNLIAAALHLFGRHGFSATSTRALAARAQTNIGSIAYYFGSKAGLHEACALDLAQRVSGAVGAPATPPDLAPRDAAALLERTLRAMIGFLVAAPDADDLVAFMLREMTDHGAALDTIYDAFVAPKHRELCALWGIATGQPGESDAVRIAVFAMIGQVAYFRIARPFVCKRMGWDVPGPAEAAQIANVLVGNLHAALERTTT